MKGGGRERTHKESMAFSLLIMWRKFPLKYSLKRRRRASGQEPFMTMKLVSSVQMGHSVCVCVCVCVRVRVRVRVCLCVCDVWCVYMCV